MQSQSLASDGYHWLSIITNTARATAQLCFTKLVKEQMGPQSGH